MDESSLPRTPGADAWNDGEDYELLFTTAFPHLPLTPIGWLTDPTNKEQTRGGWDHFRRT